MNIIINSRSQNNYLRDEYINDTNLFNGLKGAFELDLGDSIQLIRLLKYTPSEWNIDDRDTCKEKLNTYKRDVLIAKAIIDKLRGDEYDENLYDYATKIDVEKLINYKFDTERFKSKCDYCLKTSREDKVKLIDSYEYKFDTDVETEAVLYLVQKSLEKTTKVK